ncbi:NusG domain II-containing protein [Ruminococcus sp. 5_1_39BFAA]|uniref:NusG domain II-containing protein n=1 Tax=Ruminococcus sp. 5_1_39BFAA TaxID=457412 RepID=UPI003564F91E
MKKKEMIFILGFLVLAGILWIGMSFARSGSHQTIRITVDGEEYGTYSLSKDQVIRINDTNVCEIKDGKVRMTEANCPDQLCIHQRAIDEGGGTIICLPNRIVIEGEKGGDVQYDDSDDGLKIDAVT